MSYKISKELFEAVMNVKLTTDLSIAPYYNEVNGCEEEDLILINYNFIWIPLDTFFFKCKEWAFEKSYGKHTTMNTMYDLRTRTRNRVDWSCDIVEDCGDGKTIKTIYANSEQQSVFNACQWILDNKDKQ